MRLLLLLLATCGLLPAATSRQVVVTDAELTGYGDFDGDLDLDVIIVDRTTGLYRVGFQESNSTLTWTDAAPSGLPSADALTCGPVRVSGRDAVVIAGRLANQLVLLQPHLSPSMATSEQLIPTGLGPNSVAAIDLPVAGNDPSLMDLVVQTSENSTPNRQQRFLFTSLPGSTTESHSLTLGVVPERGTRLQHNSTGPHYYTAILRGTTDRLRVFRNTTTNLPVKQTLTGLRSGIEFLPGTFKGGTLEHILLYLPGDPVLQVSITNGTNLTSPASHTLAEPIESISPVGDRSFFVTYVGGLSGRLYTLDASNTPVLEQLFNAPDNSRITGSASIDPTHFSLLLGSLDGGPSLASQQFAFDGTNWFEQSLNGLPPIGDHVALTNVLLYSGEPLVDATATLVETLQIPDWTSGISVSAGGNVTLTPSAFTSSTAGLQANSALSLTADSSVTNALGNQSRPEVSLLNRQNFVGSLPPQVTISPLPGKYTTIVSPILTTPSGTTSLYYRIQGNTTWQTTTSGSAIPSPSDTLSPFTLEYYADSSSGRSPIYQAAYSYYGDPGDLDSDGDGIPDFVEIANGLDPESGNDADQDSVPDLYELLLGSDPNDGASIPSSAFDIPLQNAFDLAVTPRSIITASGTTAPSFALGGADSPTDLYLHSLDGALLAHEVTETVTGYSFPTAYFENVPATDRDLFVIVSTSPTFPIDNSSVPQQGRELIAFIPVPHQSVGSFDFDYDGVSTTATAASDWVSAAQSHYLNLTTPLVEKTLQNEDNLITVLFERILQELFLLRNPGVPSTTLSLTGFRDPSPPLPWNDPSLSADRLFSLGSEDLLTLQDWIASNDSGVLLHDLHAFVQSEIQSPSMFQTLRLRTLANQIGYYSDFLTPTEAPGLFPNPFDTLRNIASQMAAQEANVDGLIPLPGSENNTSYHENVTLSAAHLAQADVILAKLYEDLPARPTITLDLTVGGDSFEEGQVPLLFTSTGQPYELYRADGTPFLFQEPLPVGAQVDILAFTDRSHLPSTLGTPVEVITAELAVVPQDPCIDLNLNALDDEWELFFFSGAQDPFADPDNDGYSNLQEFLEDTNPTLTSSTPSATPLPLSPPDLCIQRLNANTLRLETEFPSVYSEKITFALLTQTDLALTFSQVPNTLASDNGSNHYRLDIPLPPDAKRFFRFRLQLLR